MNENKKNEVVEVEAIEETTETKEGFLTKAKGFVKKNGKKIAVGAVTIVGLGLAYGLGKKSSEETEESDEEIDYDDVEFEELATDETESE